MGPAVYLEAQEADDPVTIPGPQGISGLPGVIGMPGLDGVDGEPENVFLIPSSPTPINIQPYAPGSFLIPTGFYAMMSKFLILTGAQSVAIKGTGTLRIT
jgi:hypothetical protein